MSEPKVLFEDHGEIAVIKLNRPEKRNALDPETVLLFNGNAIKFDKETIKIFLPNLQICLIFHKHI